MTMPFETEEGFEMNATCFQVRYIRTREVAY